MRRGHHAERQRGAAQYGIRQCRTTPRVGNRVQESFIRGGQAGIRPQPQLLLQITDARKMRLGALALQHRAGRLARVHLDPPAPEIGEMGVQHGQQLLRVDIGRQRPVKRQLEPFGMPAAGRIQNGING